MTEERTKQTICIPEYVYKDVIINDAKTIEGNSLDLISIITNHVKKFEPFLVRKIWLIKPINLSKYSNSTVKIETSCVDSNGPSELKHPDDSTNKPKPLKYNGNPIYREKVKLKLGSFISYYLSKKENHDTYHYFDDTDLDFYVSQLPVSISYSSCSRGTEHSEMISLEGDNILSKIDLSIHETNIWINISEVVTNYHYDTNHNFLCVLNGQKDVYLLPPNMSHAIHFNPIHTTASNHSNDFGENQITKGGLCSSVGAGDMIFIPEGWIHSVESRPYTIGGNIWFRSVLHDVLSDHKHMSSYLIRRSIQSLMSNHMNEMRSRSSAIAMRTCHSYNVTSNDNIISYDQFERKCLCYNESVNGNGDGPRAKRRRIDVGQAQDMIERRREIFCNSYFMFHYWSRFASQYPREWVSMLLSLDADTVVYLTEYWDELEAEECKGGVSVLKGSLHSCMEEFFDSIYHPCGESTVQVREFFLKKSDEYAEGVMRRVLGDTLRIRIP